MTPHVDLHSHWLPAIDDGVRSVGEGVALLRGLRSIGFERVIATPHMRPGMFDNDHGAIETAYAAMNAAIEGEAGLPERGLSAEHYLDDQVYARLMAGEGQLYPGGRAVLIELHAEIFPLRLTELFFGLHRKGIRPVLAHPERYATVWKTPSALDPLVDSGTVLLLDVAALVGKYGRRPEKAAHHLLEEGYYYAACSDAHRPDDVEKVAAGIERLREVMGDEETEFLLGEGPVRILEGSVET